MPSLQQRAESILHKARQKGISVGRTVSERAIRDFESRYKIELPEEYAACLRYVGNGNEGPYDSVLLYFYDPLREIHPRTERVEADSRMALPFPFRNALTWEDDLSISAEQIESIYDGNLRVAEAGCGESWHLIVTGPQRGRMWWFADGGIAPFKGAGSFLDWFENWLDGVPLEFDLSDRT